MVDPRQTAFHPDFLHTAVHNKQVEVLEYLARLSSEVTTGQLDPATVNWRYIRDQVLGALARR